MNDLIKTSIESRRNALFSAYDIKDPGNLKTIDDYFVKLEEFAKDCKDVTDFETKFMSSPLSKEYTDLFVQISQTECTTEGVAPTITENDEYTLQDELKDDAERLMRRKARQKAYDVARDIPVLDEALTAKQHFDFFSRFRKKK